MLRIIVALLAGIVGLVGCTEKQPPTEEKNRAQTAAPSSEVAKAAGSPEVALSIPEGAEWTIYCQTFSGPNHAMQARQAKENLIQTSGLRDWYVVAGERESTLYYGFYRSSNPGDADGRRAAEERARIDALTDAAGNRPFRYSIIVPLNSPDPMAHPEWDLQNTPPEKYWSLQVGAYKDSPQRKQFAVEAVRDARAQGYEAYYYHGETVSHVCIGAYPREALKSQDSDQAGGDPSKPLLVLPPGLPDEFATKLQLPNNQEATRVMPKVQVVDPNLQAAMAQFPNHAVNGVFRLTKTRNPQTGQPEDVIEPSLIVVIPRRQPSILSGDGTLVTGSSPAGDETGTSGDTRPQTKKPSMTSGLKSIGE